MTPSEVFRMITARFEYVKPSVQVSAGKEALSQNQNRKTTGNRVVLVLTGSAPGKPLLRDPLTAFTTRAYRYEVHIWGFAGLQASKEEQYTAVQRLSDFVAQALFPLSTRSRFTSGSIEEEEQRQPGAHLVDVYEIDHDLPRLNGPGADVENLDYTELQLNSIRLTKG